MPKLILKATRSPRRSLRVRNPSHQRRVKARRDLQRKVKKERAERSSRSPQPIQMHQMMELSKQALEKTQMLQQNQVMIRMALSLKVEMMTTLSLMLKPKRKE